MNTIYYSREDDIFYTVQYKAKKAIILVPLDNENRFKNLYVDETIVFINDSGWCIIDKLPSTILDDERFCNIITEELIEQANTLF